MKIKVLPDVLINQIAAGEVVDRPASVVRELVDNSVDSGATDIIVTLENGGHSLIRIRDNGSGMERDDAVLALERHATSKVSSAEDLWNLTTLGFRGEALASIAAVGRLSLKTRDKDSDIGCEVVVHGGKLVNVSACPVQPGTEVEVRNLFFNLPARRKFLKSPKSELTRIKTWLMHSALSRPNVRYRLISDGEEILNMPRMDSIADRGRSLFRGAVADFKGGVPGLSVHGVVGHPSTAIADTAGLIIFVNGRMVSDKLSARAVKEGFDSTLKDREFPVGYVMVDIDPFAVDVNVHPQKSEVKFRNPDSVFSIIRESVLQGVRSFRQPVFASVSNPVPSVRSNLAETPPAYQPMPKPYKLDNPASYVAAPLAFTAVNRGPELRTVTREVHQPINEPDIRYSELNYIGQLFQCYLLCSAGERFVVIDMHAAHERINYNKMRNNFRLKKASEQNLLIPITVELTTEGADRIEEFSDTLAGFGIRVTRSGDTIVTVVAVPAVLPSLKVESLIKEIAAEEVSEAASNRFEERIDHAAARMACHASIRSGRVLSREEAYALFAELDSSEFSAACPHGRPVVIQFSSQEVERWFGRDR